MHHHLPRIRRALVPLVLAGALVATSTGDVSARSTSKVKVRVHRRTLVVQGSTASDVITLRSPAGDPTVVEVDIGGDGTADATVARARIVAVVVSSGAGDDTVTVDETPGVAVPFSDTIPTRLHGDDGDDVLLGGSGNEALTGGRGDDVVDGNRGDDRASLDGGDDEFVWDPGDGSDVIEGRAGLDVMTFNGAAGNETFTAVADRGRLRFTRNVGNIVMITDGVEQVDVHTLGGSDFTEIDDLGATDVQAIDVDLGPTLGADGSDGIVDSLFVDGTDRRDAITVAGQAGDVTITQRHLTVTATDADTFDRLLVSGRAGDDTIDASALAAGSPFLSVLAGEGNDVVLGGAGTEHVLGGPGNDVVDGNRGNDQAELEEGDDTFVWDPGDGSDIVEGADGADTMVFNGSDSNEEIRIFGQDDRVIVARDVGDIRMDTGGLERVEVEALGGVDQLSTGFVPDTTLESVRLDAGGTIGAAGSDGTQDEITITGTPDGDDVVLTGDASSIRLDGLPEAIEVADTDPTDLLILEGLGGDDRTDDTGLAAGSVTFIAFI